MNSRDLFLGISEQGKAGKHRMDDAKALFKERRWRGAMYMAGYAVECLLKTKLMRMFGCRHLRELEAELARRGVLPAKESIFTHQLEFLLRMANGFVRLRQNKDIWPRFALVNAWIPAWRYTADLSNANDSKELLDAVKAVLLWIENNI